MHVVYLTMQFDAELENAGRRLSPNFLKHRRLGIGERVQTPEGDEGRILVEGTWNTAIVSELAPQSEDIVVPKHRFSGFFETSLDSVLRARGVTTLVFTGCTTSVCVESTLRDAFYRDYRCLLLEDCTAEPVGSDFARTNHEASVLVIETLFGWVSDSHAFVAALREHAVAGVHG